VPVRSLQTKRDPQVVAAAWSDADESLRAGDEPEVLYLADGRSVVVKRSSREPDRSENSGHSFSDLRIAQLPEDPFDETPTEELSDDPFFDEPIPEPIIDEAQEDLEEEIDRRESEQDYDLFEDPTTDNSTDETPEESADDKWLDSEQLRDLDSIDLTPTVEGDDTNLEEVDTSLFDAMTLDEEDQLSEGDEDSFQYGADLDLSLPQSPNGELSEEQRQLLDDEREASEESCREEIEKLQAQTLETIDLSIRVDGSMGEDFPYECALEDEKLIPRQWPEITYMWKAAGLCHKPLYFEQPKLERYGHSWGPYTQPIISGIHFFGTLPVLPYKMGLKTPNECVYTLGYYRPGSCAPYLVGGFPFTWRAAAFQAGAVTGAAFIYP